MYPELVEEFHLVKNEPFTPDNLPSGTGRKLHWICRTCSHEWRAVGAARANGGGCGVCIRGNFHSDGRNSMRNTHPHLAEEFHPTKNGKMTPDNIIAGVHKKLHWICNTCSNEWVSTGANRRHGGNGCSSCNLGRLHSDGRNSMRNTHPHLAEEFHPTKNADLTPDNLVAGTARKLHWICRTCSHEWENFGYGRAGGEGCAFCNAFALHSDGRNSMANTHPELVIELHPIKNGDFDPNKVVAGTHNRLHWMCRTCSNEWVSSGNERTHQGSGCSSCNLGRLHSDGRNSMRNTHPHLAEEFHPTKNGDLTPDNLVAGTNKSLHWICSTCSHEWETTGNSRGFGGSGCGVCNTNYLHEDGRNSMRNTHPQLADEFHPTKNGDLTPDNLVAGTNLILHWICSTCSHEWAVGGNNRSTSNNPSGCGVCNGGALHSDGRNSMRNTHPHLAEEFHPTKNGAYTPDNLKASTHRRVFWICSKCSHEWKTAGSNRTTGETGCPLCCDFGFQLDKPGYYYVHEIINMNTGERLFYKGGISNDWEGRFAKIRRGLPEGMSIHNIEHILFERGEQALALESTLLGIEEIRAPVRSFDGGTELFLFHPLEYARTHGHLS
ncbi:zinc-ribbon domain-containing protein [Candidatus Poseidoniales archaeon]|nr:zinc-ribbon domain-containing protein [Candidatus Poseidoniales archaeon]